MRSTLSMVERRDAMARALTAMNASRCHSCLSRWAWLLLGLLLTVPLPVPAHEGEVHDDFPATASATGRAGEPRFAAASDAVEVVGVLHEGQLWLYVSRFATNAPWPGLRIEIELGLARDGGSKRAEPVSEGIYRVAAGDLVLDGGHTVVMSLQGEGIDELLMAQLLVENGPGQRPGRPWLEMSTGLGLLAAAVAIHLLHGWRVRRRVLKESRQETMRLSE